MELKSMIIISVVLPTFLILLGMTLFMILFLLNDNGELDIL